VACRREGWSGKALQHHEIGHDPGAPGLAGPSRNRVGIGATKLPHPIPLIVHYLIRPIHRSEVWAPEAGDAPEPLEVAALVVPDFFTAADVLAEPCFATDFDVPAAVVPRTLLLRR
jgi:hypothetical protein